MQKPSWVGLLCFLLHLCLFAQLALHLQPWASACSVAYAKGARAIQGLIALVDSFFATSALQLLLVEHQDTRGMHVRVA